jgi:predicted house-cleaning noncanonical NTP pyrophosphatase (MazG superfamily)
MNIDKAIIIEAIKSHNELVTDHYAEVMAEKIVNELDERLEKNLVEWINDEEISDLWIGTYCVNAIMAIRGDNNFLDALLTMNLYLQDEDKGTRRIWRGRK